MAFLQWLQSQFRPLLFGLTNALASSLGQTHLIALFSPWIIAHYSLSHTSYGSLYSLATLASGLTIPFVGPLIDRVDLRFFCLALGGIIVTSELVLATTPPLAILFIVLFALRLAGQGLCSQVAGISMARYFTKNRGKALGIATLGFPLGEGLITPMTALLLTVFPWTTVCGFLALGIAVFYIPIVAFSTKGLHAFNKPSSPETNPTRESQNTPNRGHGNKSFPTPQSIGFCLKA